MTYEYAGFIWVRQGLEEALSIEVWKCPRCSSLVIGTEADRDHHENWHHSFSHWAQKIGTT